jgi:hypothetical protein
MRISKKTLLFIIIAAIISTIPIKGFSMEIKREAIPIVQKLQEGKAKISPDKKSIIDEEGHIIGKETPTLDMNKYKAKPTQNPFEAAKDDSPPPPQMFICTRKCGMITKRCYLDENENAVCINICDKESLICENPQ